MLRMRKTFFFFLIVLPFLFPIRGYAQTSVPEKSETEAEFSDIQHLLDEQGTGIDFSGLVHSLLNEEDRLSLENLLLYVSDSMKEELAAKKEVFLFLAGLTIITGVLVNYSDIFRQGQTSQIAYYCCYLILFSSLLGAYYIEMDLAKNTFLSLLSFMRVLLPSYFIGMTFQGQLGSSAVLYESTLYLISLIEKILVFVLIPASNCYFLVLLADDIGERERFSKLAELLGGLIRWTLNAMLAAVTGFHVIEGLVVPFKDRLARSAVLNGMEAVPFIGNTAQGIAKTVAGSGMVIKNAVGAAGLIVLVLICALPVLRLYFHSFLYKCVAAVTQPVADKRFTQSINAASHAASLLGRMVFTGAVMFFLTIAVIGGTTSFSGS